MHARVARYEVAAERIAEAVEAFRQAARAIESLPGLRGGYVMVDPDDGKLVTATFWDSRAALEASEVRASRARQDAIRAVGGDCTSVDRLEIAAEIGGGAGA
jgi:heme-degrading monooxygenase HmoA